MKFKKILSLTLALVMCFALTACGQGQSDSNANPDGSEEETASVTSDSTDSADVDSDADSTDDDTETVITLCESWDFSGGFAPAFKPASASNTSAAYWGRNFYNTLVSYDDNGEIVGELAESWDISDDGLTYTFYLQDGIKFSDGTDLTAEAVKISFEAAVYNLGDYNGSYGMLTALFDTIEVVDDLTVAITLTQPYYGTLNDLTMSCPLAIINPVAFEDADDLSYGDLFLTATYGTGPYMYVGEYEDGTYTFISNPYYWGDELEVDSFEVIVIEDNDAKLLALQSGEIDAILDSSQISFDGYTSLSAADVFDTSINDETTYTRYLGLNISSEPFDDVLVRQAVAYAIDQSELATSVFNGLETIAETLFPDALLYCDVEQTTYETDVDKANELMEEAGWIDTDGDGIREKDGVTLELDLYYVTSLASIDDAALVIASQLKQIGISVNVIGTDIMTYYSSSATSPLVLAYTYGGAFDPTTFVTTMNPTVSADFITMQFADFFEDGILDELNSTADLGRVQEIYEEILITIADQCLLVPLTRSHELAIWNADVISGYDFCTDTSYIDVSGIHLN